MNFTALRTILLLWGCFLWHSDLGVRHAWGQTAPAFDNASLPTVPAEYHNALPAPSHVGTDPNAFPLVPDNFRMTQQAPIAAAPPIHEPAEYVGADVEAVEAVPVPAAEQIVSSMGVMDATDAGGVHCGVPPTNGTTVPVYPQIPPTQMGRANLESDGTCLLLPYQGRGFSALPQAGEMYTTSQIPPHYQAWWSERLSQPMMVAGSRSGTLPVSLDQLLHAALIHSPHVQVAAIEPHVRRTQVFVEAAEFDWRDYLNTRYNDTNDPVGNTLATGDPNDDRFIEQEWSGSGGMRRRNKFGGELDISQQLGHLTNNTIFLLPPNQGNTRLQLNYRQPLLQGRGRAFNESLILLAKIDYNSSTDDYMAAVQEHLVKITRAYWELVRARAALLQRQKALQAAEVVLKKLEGRRALDVMQRQVLRARAAVETRRAEIVRAQTSIRNAESQLRLLVNDPSWNAANLELLPVDLPRHDGLNVELADALSTALKHRPDISKAIRDLRSANLQLGIAKNQVLPKLDMLVGTYVAGLDGNSDIFNAWVNQFRDGQPGFNVGLEFELPRGNRAAMARQRRRNLELNRSYHQFRAVVETSLTETEIAVREVETAQRELVGRYHSMLAAAKENNYLYDRFQTLPGANDSATLLLEDFLESQLRLAVEEAAFAQAQADYVIASMELKQVMGTLFIVSKQGTALSGNASYPTNPRVQDFLSGGTPPPSHATVPMLADPGTVPQPGILSDFPSDLPTIPEVGYE